MGKRNREYGLMAGIAIGFAIWGSVRVTPEAMGVGVVAGETMRTEVMTPETMQAEFMAEEAGPAVIFQTEQAIPITAASTSSPRQEPLSLHALSAVLIDGDSGRILYEKDAATFRPMASTTKIMTCILALENGNLSDICTASAAAAAQPQVHLGVRTGQQFGLKDLLYSLMLESHNDAAVIIAEHIGGSVENFAGMMNQKARDLGCMDTCFVTPNGLDATYAAPDGTTRTHGTTAADLARILRYCIRESPKRAEFLEVTRTANYSFTDADGKNCYSCVNHNALLSMMEGALSGKTGFTGGAGYSYVGAIEDEGRTFVLALLGCGWPPHKTWKWADARTLFRYGKERYHYRDVYREPELSPIPVEDGIPRSAADESTADRNAADESTADTEHAGQKEAVAEVTTGIRAEEKHWNLLLSEEEQVTQRVQVPDHLDAPVEAGQIVGSVDYVLNGEVIRTDPLYVVYSVKQKNFRYFVCRILNCFFMDDADAAFL